MYNDENAERNEKIVSKAIASTLSVPKYSFQAQTVLKVGNTVIPTCLIGAVSYGNPTVKIVCAMKVEEWLFCVEENVAIPANIRLVVVGAFLNGNHHTFCSVDSSKTGFELQKTMIDWVFKNVLHLFHPEGISVFVSAEEIRSKLSEKEIYEAQARGREVSMEVTAIPTALKKRLHVPDDVKSSSFIANNPDLMP